MADTSVAVTAGSGTNIDTRTETTNGNHRQVVVLGDPSTNAGVAPVDGTSGLKVDLGADNDVTVTGTVTANLSATDNAVLDDIALDTEAIKTAVEIIDNAIAGTEMQVDVVTSALPTGASTSAKQDDIITAIGAIPGGGGIQYTEGDTDATITGTAALVEGAANALAVMTQPLTDTQLRASAVPVSATDLDIRNLTNTDVVTAELSAVDNAVLDTIAAKDFATQTTLSAINAKLVTGTDIGDVTINNASGASAVNIQDGGNTITVDGTVGVSGTVTVGSHAVTNAGTFVTQENGALLTAAQLIDDTVFADDAAVTLGTSKGNIFAGVAVQTDGTDPTAVSAEGDAAALRTDMNRILLVNQTHPRGSTVSADYASAQTNVSVIAAPGASLSIYITDIMLSNGATAGNVTLLDGSGGTVKWEAYPAINGGAVLTGLRQPIKLTANTALCLTSTTVTTHSIFIGYYIAA